MWQNTMMCQLLWQNITNSSYLPYSSFMSCSGEIKSVPFLSFLLFELGKLLWWSRHGGGIRSQGTYQSYLLFQDISRLESETVPFEKYLNLKNLKFEIQIEQYPVGDEIRWKLLLVPVSPTNLSPICRSKVVWTHKKFSFQIILQWSYPIYISFIYLIKSEI